MAVKYKKAGPKAKVKVKPPKSQAKQSKDELVGLVESFGVLDSQVKSFKPVIDEHKKVKDLIQTKLDDQYDKDENAMIEGVVYTLSAGMKGNTTKVTDLYRVREILDSISPDLFMKLASIKITDLKKYLTEAQMKEVTEVTRSGSRSLKVFYEQE